MALKFLVIPDSFKNCLSAPKVGAAIKEGLNSEMPDARVTVLPLADGGEGTVHAIISALSGEIIKTKVCDPLGRRIESFYGILPDKKTALIEMAAASGIELLAEHEKNPMHTTTFGTGELMKYALDKGCQRIIVGIGGSATNDGGVGMAKALGYQFLNAQGNQIQAGGDALLDLHRIDASKAHPKIKSAEIQVACDVQNVLYGPTGASHIYAKQKGADSHMIEILDNNLKHLSSIILNDLHIDVSNIAGGGAAGGLGAGLHAFCEAKMIPGFQLIAELLHLEEKIKQSDIIISAEGAVDSQTLYGKAPAGVAQLAQKYQKPVFVFTGNASNDIQDLNKIGIQSLIPITRYPTSLDEAILNAEIWLKTAAIELCKIIKVGQKLK